jgi:hypothetical protein
MWRWNNWWEWIFLWSCEWIIDYINIIHNPWFSKYFTKFEDFEDRSKSVYTLFTKVVKCSLEEPFLGQSPFVANSVESNVESLSICWTLTKELKQ